MFKQIRNVDTGEIVTDYIRRVSDTATIPCVEGNRDYQEYLAWLAEGNEPLPADDPS